MYRVLQKARDAAKLISEENHEKKLLSFVFVMILIGGSLLWLGSNHWFSVQNLAD